MSALAPLDLPFVSKDLPGIGGSIRVRPEHFLVEEIPLREPNGRGDFVRAFVEKRRMSTPELVHELSERLRLPPHGIGVAGNKDSDAVTRQWISLPSRVRPRLERLGGDRFRFLRIEGDSHPVTTGDLFGNRFTIEIHDLADSALALSRAMPILAMLERRGVPNYFGPQRFGTRGNAATIGSLFLRGESERALEELLAGEPTIERDPAARRFRELCARCEWRQARTIVPRSLRLEAMIVDGRLERAPTGAIVKRIPERDRRMFLSAYQSRIFNRIIAARIDTLDRALLGDVLFDHRDSALVACTEPVREQAAVDRFERSPTGWMPGERIGPAAGAPGEIEKSIFATDPIPPERFSRPLGLTLTGERRPLRVQVFDCDVSPAGKGGKIAIRMRFTLPRGSFATAVLDEVMKTRTGDAGPPGR